MHTVTNNDTNTSTTRYSSVFNVDSENLSNSDPNTSSSSHILTSTLSPIHAKADSGATDHYWRESDSKHLSDIHLKEKIVVNQPDKTTLESNTGGKLLLSEHLSNTAQQVNILPGLKSSSLISLGKLCDDDCNVVLTKKNCLYPKITKSF